MNVSTNEDTDDMCKKAIKASEVSKQVKYKIYERRRSQHILMIYLKKHKRKYAEKLSRQRKYKMHERR